MARTARRLLTVAFLGGVLAMPSARAQAPAPPPGAATPAPPIRNNVADIVEALPAPLPDSSPTADGAWEPPLLQSLPHPPDQPLSLFQPAPPPGPPPPDFERYFEVDPLLDPPRWGNPTGWFTDFDLGVIQPHVNFGQMRLINSLKVPSGQRANVAPGAGKLPWTVAPRFEVGYRLPSGFGSLAFSDRFFNSSGTGSFVGPAGATSRTTSLGINYSDWDYISREFTPWDTERTNWSLDWRVGVRLAESWTDVRVDKPFSAAASTNGVFIQGDSNYTVGAGPHFGLALERKDLPSGLSFIAKIDIADTFARDRQLFAASTTTLTAAGVPERGAYTQNFWSQIPILNYQVGMGWQPPANPNIALYVGYVYEFWFQYASNMEYTNSYTTQGATRGSMSNQGLVFRFHWKW
ncbi:MAG: hypothetical protein ACLQGP_39975 [Isosphaeraceae bacterium]